MKTTGHEYACADCGITGPYRAQRWYRTDDRLVRCRECASKLTEPIHSLLRGRDGVIRAYRAGRRATETEG